MYVLDSAHQLLLALEHADLSTARLPLRSPSSGLYSVAKALSNSVGPCSCLAWNLAMEILFFVWLCEIDVS